MNRSAVLAAVAVALVFGVFLFGCREEPTIVIKFEPNDLSGATVTARPADMATAPKPAPADMTVVAKKKKGAAPECKVAADCVVEPIECCDCANGGKQEAVTKKAAAASKKARAEQCKTKMCTMMLSTDPTCGMRADCVEGACTLVPKK
ncbi:MAG TPA: hypothetical protein VN947_18465 [Polyangia bacterium]|nr:hypothetical protein [Polyangia bacterium]